MVSGYGILQPRVTPSLPIGREASFYQRVISPGGGGMNPLRGGGSPTSTQDPFGEGSYTEKGITRSMPSRRRIDERIPENTLLSHDLFRGRARSGAGLASDVEVARGVPALRRRR